MTLPCEHESPGTIVLEHGRLTARPGPDRYVYAFRSAACALPDIGRRGDFVSGPNSFPARLIDRRGPLVSISLKADKPLGPGLSGFFRPLPTAPTPGPTIPDDALPLPSGARLFLDPADGWVMSAAEAAGNQAPVFEARHWPTVCAAEIPSRLSPSGLTFVWRQRPDESSGVAASLAGHLRECGRTLVVADSPEALEELAEMEGAVFTGEASPGTPLHPLGIHTKAAEAHEAREREQAELRNAMALLKRDEAAVKSRLGLWEDLDESERRFENLGREVARFREQWALARLEVESSGKLWEEARAAADRSGQGLLGWMRKGGPGKKAALREERTRLALQEAEEAMRAVRREEESSLEEARRLESRLRLSRAESESWPARADLEAELERLRERQDQCAARLAASLARPPAVPERFLAEAGLILALAADLGPGEILAGRRFAAVLALTGPPPDHDGRNRLAALVLTAEKHLVICGDFTFWPVWSGRAPVLPDQPETPAWSGLIAAEERDELKLFLAEGGLWTRPLPDGSPSLSRLESGTGPESASVGFGLRAVGEIGPANPVSALAVARAAVNYASSAAGDGPAAVILTASAAQAALVNLMLRDLKAPDGRVHCGEPHDFIHWPQVPLVILEPAFEAPHLSHPWAWPSFGRRRLMWAWRLAGERIWLAGRDGWMRRLPESAPLALLWSRAEPPDPNISNPLREEACPAFWEALDKARQEVWAVLPVFEPHWWKPLEGHFLAAARRRATITILTAPPDTDADREYAGQVLRTLSAYGCRVHLAEGFPGFMAVIDGLHLTWGHFAEGTRGPHIWGGLNSAAIPEAGPEIAEILQLRLINEKMGRRGGGQRNCPECGWPMVVINQQRPRGFGDEQPLKLSCLGCRSPKTARRIDERDPFSAPPRCGLNGDSRYRRVWRGRQESWICPDHPDGPDCPSFRVLPGDVK